MDQRPEAAGGTTDPTPTRRLSAPECWSQLRRQRVGRLSYRSGRGPRHVVVPYVVRDHELVVQVPAYNEAAQYVGGCRTTFDVVARTGERSADRVEVAGRARVAGPRSGGWDALADEQWPPDASCRWVWLSVDEVHGVSEQVGSGTRAS